LPAEPATGQQPGRDTTALPPPLPPDTFPFFYSYAQNHEQAYPAADTLPDNDFRMYDPARRQPIDWGTLGNVGASARPLFFQTEERSGFRAGHQAYDLYRLRPTDLQFYRNTRSFTDLFYSQGGFQNDNTLRAKFSRTFSGDLNFSVLYRTFNHLGQYRYQAAKHSALTFGLWYPTGPRYEFFLIYTSNTSKQQENGGLADGAVIGGGEFSGPINAAVRLPDEQALTRHASSSLYLAQHLRFAGDSTPGKRVLRASHTAEWGSQTYKFSDPGSKPELPMREDTLFFDTFLVDIRGIRTYFELDRLENTVVLNTFKSKNAGTVADKLAVGLNHSLFFLRQEPLRDSTFSNLFLTGELAITPSDRFSFTASGKLGLLANLGEYLVRGDLEIGLGKAGKLRATLLSQRYPPDLMHQRLFVSQRLFWQNNFEKPVETTLSATYSLPALGLEVTGKTHLVNNYLYYDQRGLAAQTGSPLQVAQLLLRGNFRLGHFRFDNTIAIQRFNRSDVVRLPGWFTKNSLYYSGPVFKKRMQLEIGADFRMNADFTPDGYQPATAQFHLQDTLSALSYPWLDVFASLKVDAFRCFVRYENLGTVWDGQRLFYQTARYPQPFGALRFGIGWRFLDDNRERPANTPGGNAPPAGRQ
ncbi:MAG: putative porin, partial [Saprospiraceae bacterium]